MNRIECLIIGLFIPLLVCASGKNDIHKREIAYLKDFAEIYGTVRWFMPSDEARNTDWDALCLYGVDKILECRTDEEFYYTLERMDGDAYIYTELAGCGVCIVQISKQYGECHFGCPFRNDFLYVDNSSRHNFVCRFQK